MSRAIISRLRLIWWRGLLPYCTLCCAVICKHNFVDVAAFLKVVQVICFKKADLSVVPTKFKQLHGLIIIHAQQDAVLCF
jgi:hypothetical protein